MSNLKSMGYISAITTLPNSTTQVAAITVLSGTDNKDKKRYLNGSFIVTSKTKGVSDDLLKEIANAQNGILVKVEIKDLFAEISQGTQKAFINYRGLLQSVEKHVKKEEA